MNKKTDMESAMSHDGKHDRSRRRTARLPVAALCGAALFASALAQPGFAQDTTVPADTVQAALREADVVHMRVHVAAVDAASNRVLLRGPRGQLADVEVNRGIADVSRLRVGDRLNVAYQQAMLIRVEKLATQDVRERTETTLALPASAGVVSSAHRVRIVATVVRIDGKNCTVTLRGPKHRQLLQVARDIPLDELHVGESVRAEFVSAAAVSLVRE
ncbi:hypothetical protein [Burkholderia sp. Ax-1724]|uniref:hypothetical protein n=1 Tax=Burkholderia sp. Ax-1724 TaxID=2608336 RepID=UPI00141F46A5|nr:hypothetical protein [Burkholderia sp. Ax-1724]NIF55270.1 hypothetical protein [Burkholderia sp. Ax-1724]